MNESSSRTLKPGSASACLVAVAIAITAGSFGGCTPSEYGSIDIEKSKAIAAEKGIGPGAKRPEAKKGGPPRTAPAAPAPR